MLHLYLATYIHSIVALVLFTDLRLRKARGPCRDLFRGKSPKVPSSRNSPGPSCRVANRMQNTTTIHTKLHHRPPLE